MLCQDCLVSLFNTLGPLQCHFQQGINDELNGMNKEVNKEISIEHHKNLKNSQSHIHTSQDDSY